MESATRDLQTARRRAEGSSISKRTWYEKSTERSGIFAYSALILSRSLSCLWVFELTPLLCSEFLSVRQNIVIDIVIVIIIDIIIKIEIIIGIVIIIVTIIIIDIDIDVDLIVGAYTPWLKTFLHDLLRFTKTQSRRTESTTDSRGKRRKSFSM